MLQPTYPSLFSLDVSHAPNMTIGGMHELNKSVNTCAPWAPYWVEGCA